MKTSASTSNNNPSSSNTPPVPGTTSPTPPSPKPQAQPMADASATTTNTGAPSAYYRIDPLQGGNWPQWKRRVIAVLRERGLLDYVTGTGYVVRPKATDEDNPDDEEKKKLAEWDRKDGQARTQLELSIGDSEM
ncbi:hypothetical protein FRC01_011505, partial [Tulasnella sp. 417]